MPTLSLTLSTNGGTNNWSDVEVPLLQIRTLVNTTGLDYVNVQTNGLRAANLRAHAGVTAGRVKVRNDTGVALAASAIVYPSGTYSDGTDNYPTVALAVSTQSRATTKYGSLIIDAAINDGADGTALLSKEVANLNTSALAVNQPVLLSDVAGGYVGSLSDLADEDYGVQIVGFVSYVHATLGRIVFGNWSIIPWSIADQCVL
jgi:hypothetical protein